MCMHIYNFLYSKYRMNLSAQEYLNLVDQITLLRIQNQRYHRDNTTLATQIERQKQILHEVEENNILVPISNYKSNALSRNQQRYTSYKNADDYAEEFKLSINSMQKNICEFIKMSTTQQMEFLKQEIKKIRQSLKQVKQDDKQNKQNAVLGQRRKENQEDRRINQKQDKCGEGNNSKNKQIQQFYEKAKFIYTLWNNDKKEPTVEELCQWVNKINVESVKPKPVQENNPIRSVKQASKLKRLNQNSSKQIKQSPKRKQSQRKSVRKQKNSKDKQQTDRLIVDQFIKNYSKLRPQSKQKLQTPKKKLKKSNENQGQQEEQVSLLKPKTKGEQKKKKQSVKNIQATPKLKKKSIANHKEQLTGALGLVKQQRAKKIAVSENKNKIQRPPSKKKIVNDSQQKITTQISKKIPVERKNSQKILENSKSLGQKNIMRPSIQKIPSKKKLDQHQQKIKQSSKKIRQKQNQKQKDKIEKKVKQSSKKINDQSQIKPSTENKRRESKLGQKLIKRDSKQAIPQIKQTKSSPKGKPESKAKIQENNKSKTTPKKGSVVNIKGQEKKKQKEIRQKQMRNFLSDVFPNKDKKGAKEHSNLLQKKPSKKKIPN